MKVYKVERAQKDYPQFGISKGEPYYWWAPYRAPKRMSKTYPRPSQLESNETVATFLSIQETVEDYKVTDFGSGEDIAVTLEEVASDVESCGEEFREKFENMPEGLQSGEVGETLEQRADGCETVHGNIEDAIYDIRTKWEAFVEEYGEDAPDDTLGLGRWVVQTSSNGVEWDTRSAHSDRDLANLALDEFVLSLKSRDPLPQNRVHERPFRDAEEWTRAFEDCMADCFVTMQSIDWSIE